METLRKRNKILLFVLAALCALALGLGVTALAPAPERAFAEEGDVIEVQFNGETTTYTTVKDALAYTDEQETSEQNRAVIKLLDNYVLGANGDDSWFEVGSDTFATLDLNGYILWGSGSGFVIRVYGDMILKDSQSESTAEEHQHNYYVDESGLWMVDDGSTEWQAAYNAAENKGSITGGIITGGDSSNYGGGIYLGLYGASGGGILTMNGGTIAGNESLRDGGGIYSDDSTIDMSGGSIEKNTACIGIQNGGGGIYAQSELTKINISGAPVVSGNKFIKEESSELKSNLLLREDWAAKAYILGQLTDGAKIGVTLYYYDKKTKDRLSVTGLVTEGYSDYNTADPSEYFFADNADYTVVLNGDGEAEIVVKSYIVVYVVDGTRTEKEYTIGEALTLEKVAAEEGYLGGWSLTEGGTSIDYSSGQSFADGLGKAHGDVITLYAVQVRDYAADVEGLRAELEAAVEQMNAAIDALEEQIGKDVAQEVSSLTQKIEALDKAYKAADALLEGKIGALESADASLASQISTLTSSLNEAKNTLQSAIDQVAADLETAKAELQAAIDANGKDIEEKLAALDKAYKAADALLASDIAGLEGSVGELNEADEALQAALDALDEAYRAADEALAASVEELKGQLDEAVSRLEELLSEGDEANAAALAEAVSELKTAFEAADDLLASDIAELESSGEALQAALDALDEAYRAADEAVLKTIGELQTENVGLREELDGQEKELSTLNAVVWVAFAVAVLAVGVGAAGLVFGIKAGKRDNSAS